MLIVTVAIAWIAHSVTGVDTLAAVIAYAPGGLTEMSLVALGMGFSVGYVATLHLLRILFIALLAPILLRMYGIATPTEAGALGALGAMLLALAHGRLTLKLCMDLEFKKKNCIHINCVFVSTWAIWNRLF